MSQNPQKGLPDLDEFFKKLTPSFRKKNTDPFQAKNVNLGWWMFVIVLLVIVVVVFSSMVTVKPGEALVVTRFGVYVRTDGPGLHFTIPVVEERHLFNLDTENTIAIQTQNVTIDDCLVDVSATVAYTINDPKAYLLAGNAKAAIQSELSQAITVVMLQSNFADLLNDEIWKGVGDNIQKNMLDLSSFGVKVTGVEIQSIRVPNELAGAFNSTLANARNQVKQMVNDANAFAADLKPLSLQKAARSIAYANAEKFAIMVSATRDAAEFQSLLPAYQTNNSATLAYLPLLLANSWKSVHAISSQDSATPSAMTQQAGGSQSGYLRWQAAVQNQGAGQNEEN